jgi:hypothetical protein
MVGLAAVVAALLGLILCHVARAVLMSASSLPERHPCLPSGAHVRTVGRGSFGGGGGGDCGCN